MGLCELLPNARFCRGKFNRSFKRGLGLIPIAICRRRISGCDQTLYSRTQSWRGVYHISGTRTVGFERLCGEVVWRQWFGAKRQTRKWSLRCLVGHRQLRSREAPRARWRPRSRRWTGEQARLFGQWHGLRDGCARRSRGRRARSGAILDWRRFCGCSE